MKNIFKTYNDLTATIILEAIVGVVVIGLSCLGLIFRQPGWIIGSSTGTLVAMISTLLVFRGSDSTLKENKSGFYILAYFLRMILFVGMIVVFALLDYKFKYVAFEKSIWGALIGYSPMFIILIICQMKATHDLDKKVEEKNKVE